MNALPWRRSLWARVVLLVYVGAAAGSDELRDANLCSTSSDTDELQLLQVQAVVTEGKERVMSPPMGTSHARPLFAPGAETESEPPKLLKMHSASDLLSNFVKLVSEEGTAAGTLARSTMASQLVFGFNGRYCERRFGGLLNHHDHDGNHGPEILNTVTAIYIFLVGTYQLAAWNHQSAFIRLLSACVVINGWSSAARHFADVPFCAILDGMTMVVGAVLGCCFMVDLATQRTRNWVTIAALRVAVWAGMPVLFCLCFCRNPHSFDAHTTSSVFRVMFALPLICIAVAVYGSLWCNWVAWASVDPEALRAVKYQLKVGIPLCCLGAICLGLSELFCDDSPIAQYFPGHALWHLLFPFGVNALLLYVCALWADTKHQPMTFYKGENAWKSCWLSIWPAFTSFAPVHWEQ